ncbi:MAG: EamA family transporter [Gammaproteobacteria bacterium]|nr:EamA family transporter [Gammaproteobacteria bacterium]
MKTLIVAILSIVFAVSAQFSLKKGMSSAEIKAALSEPFGVHSAVTVFSDKFVFGGFVLYTLAALVWLRVISTWDVSKAYPLMGLGFVFTVIIGWMIGEQVTAARAFGVMLICAGVVLVGQS